ncbi:transmembrane protein 135-like [Varroa jacobsoni]|uniref:Transmembrane protein 135 N-terminal domain-containing protein n=1 Tax=Varroa destructor TaxID=109461 RepID=A0A7M7JBQ4_VARDE|nr:transmembrane protein 135-like [Varroa destructor]XP_022699060.1 transmembrane protein 135-like [Varroa jacobsoni]
MTILSKLLLSRLRFNCYELGHTWNPSCSQVRLQLFTDSYKSLLPLYLFLNSSSYIYRYKTVSYKNLWPIVRTVLVRSHRSATALGIFFFVTSLILCNVGHYLGFYNPLILYMASFVSAFLAGIVETDRRLHLYIVYMLQLTFEMFVALARDYQIKGHPIITPLVLAASIATHTYYSRTNGLSQTNFSNFLLLIVGKQNLSCVNSSDSTNTAGGGGGTTSKTGTSICETQGQNLCRHIDTCASFALKRSAIVFACGAGASLGFRLVSSIPQAIMQVRSGLAVSAALRRILSKKNMTMAVDLGAGLASFCGVYNRMACYLRQRNGKEELWHTIPSSVLATFASYLFWPSERLAIYALCNTLYDLYMAGVKKQTIPIPPYGPQLTFALISGIMFAMGSLKPHYVRKSYVNFLNRILGRRISLINWSAISYMGFDSSKVYKENLPFLLNPEYVSRFYMQTMWVWSLADHVNKTYSRQPVPS